MSVRLLLVAGSRTCGLMVERTVEDAASASRQADLRTHGLALELLAGVINRIREPYRQLPEGGVGLR